MEEGGRKGGREKEKEERGERIKRRGKSEGGGEVNKGAKRENKERREGYIGNVNMRKSRQTQAHTMETH